MQEQPIRSQPVTIDVVSDVVCPWCYIGKRHLEAALDAVPSDIVAAGVGVRWHAFQLNPDLPPEGIDRAAYLEAKFGGTQRASERYARVIEAGRRAGIAFEFERIVRQPNTRDAHRLLAWAQRDGADASTLVEALFRAYFIEGRNIGQREVLAQIANEAGRDGDAVRAYLASNAGIDEVAAADIRARNLGITGVPFFVFDGRYGASGAQPPEVLAQTLVQAVQETAPAGG